MSKDLDKALKEIRIEENGEQRKRLGLEETKDA